MPYTIVSLPTKKKVVTILLSTATTTRLDKFCFWVYRISKVLIVFKVLVGSFEIIFVTISPWLVYAVYILSEPNVLKNLLDAIILS